jgi:hypothetical protein
VGFEPDNKIQQVAEAYAEDAIELAGKHYGLKLDWTDESVKHVETVLASLYDDIPNAKPTDEQIFQFAKALGSYVGEVFRRNHGAVWGTVTLGTDSFPGMRADRTGGEFWPWGKAYNRLKNGPEDNVWHYYCFLRSKDGRGPELKELDPWSPAPRVSWWRKMFGGA